MSFRTTWGVEMANLDPMSPHALADQAKRLGLRICSDQIFDSLQAMTQNRVLNIEHRKTRVTVAGDIHSRIEIFRFLSGWEYAIQFANEDWKKLQSPTESEE